MMLPELVADSRAVPGTGPGEPLGHGARLVKNNFNYWHGYIGQNLVFFVAFFTMIKIFYIEHSR